MFKQQKILLSGRLTLEVFDARMRSKQVIIKPNLIVNTGLGHVMDLLRGQAPATMGYIALGTNNASPASANTALGAEAGRASASLTYTPYTLTYVSTFGPGVATGTLVEAGIFNAVGAGTMLCRTTFQQAIKGALDTMQARWDISAEAA